MFYESESLLDTLLMKSEQTQVSNLFESMGYSEEKKAVSDAARIKASELYQLFESQPSSREKSLAVTALEESLMWFNKHLSRNP